MPLVLAFAFACLQDTAEQTFAKVEKNLREGKSVSLTFKGSMKAPDETGEFTGRLRLKSGNRFTFTLTMKQGEQTQVIEVKSDGKKVIVLSNGEKQDKNTREGSGALFTSAVSRSGFIYFFLAMNSHIGDDALPAPDSFMKASGHKDVTDSSVPGQERTLKFTVALSKIGDLQSELVVDSKSLFPKKYTGVLTYQGKEVRVTESYEDVSTDEIPDAEFEHKK